MSLIEGLEALYASRDTRLDLPAIPEVVAYNREFRESGKYPYNADIKRFIMERESIPAHLTEPTPYRGSSKILQSSALDGAIYTSQKYLQAEARAREIESMAAQGWKILDSGCIADLAGLSVLVKLSCDAEPVKMTGRKTAESGVLLFPPRCTRKGYSAMSFALAERPAYYKAENCHAG